MCLRSKTSYHPYLLVAFYLKCLLDDLMLHIPRSTRHGWHHKDQACLYGYEWYRQNQHTFDTLQQIVSHQRLMKINKALIRVIALRSFIMNNAARIKDNVLNIQHVVLTNLHKVTRILGLCASLKYLQLSYSSYLRLRRKTRCSHSILALCRTRHPAQLLPKEINVIVSYCSDLRFLHWPLASVYHQMRRDGAGFFDISTFYKYVGLLRLKRSHPRHRRKNHHTGIRATEPLQILHADATVFRTADGAKNYIHLVEDNFSRAILSYRVSTESKARHTFDNLESVRQNYLIPLGIHSCQLITDDGSENAGVVKEWLLSCDPPVQHLIAQRDILFSNSMIEAANKQLKYRFLYHQHIPDLPSLVKYIEQAITDFQNRPHHVLQGQTPLEVLYGGAFDKNKVQQHIAIAKSTRIIENKKMKCCHYSF